MKTNDSHEFSHYTNKYKLTEEQIRVYNWLRQQGLNTDDNTLCFWSKKYPPKRIVEVVQFAQKRLKEGQTIRNIGGWVHRLLTTGLAVTNDECEKNKDMAQKFARAHNWKDLKIYEKYIKDEVTNDDLPLTLSQPDFNRALEALYRKSLLYKSL
jgi:hypothetical protein